MNAFAINLERDVAAVGTRSRTAIARVLEQATARIDRSTLLESIDEIVADGATPSERPLTEVEWKQRLSGIAECLRGDQEALNTLLMVGHLDIEIISAINSVANAVDVPRISERPPSEDPCAWLSSWPVELAELRLAAERGQVAAAILGSAPRMGDGFGLEEARELTRLWRDGLAATLRMIASVFPSVPESIVANSLRVDAVTAARGQAAWERFAGRLLAE